MNTFSHILAAAKIGNVASGAQALQRSWDGVITALCAALAIP